VGGLKLFFVDEEMLMEVAALFGEDAVRVVEVLEKVDEITSFQIADQTEIRLSTVRKTLYRLYDHSLVGLRRTRDKETGWFVACMHFRLLVHRHEWHLRYGHRIHSRRRNKKVSRN